jgi:NDP-sugar pyrophosphorylase family protein
MNYAIIAAGEGSRLVQDGVKLPKPLVELNDIPLIDRLVAIFCRNNAESVSIIINEEMTEVRQHIEALPVTIPLHLVVKSTPSSMHSFYELSRFLRGNKFCLTTVDTVFKEEEFAAYIRNFENDTTFDGWMAVTDYIDDEKPLYVSIDEKTMQIDNFSDTSEGKENAVSGGIYGLTPAALHTLDRCMEKGMSRMRNYQRQLIADGLKLKACPFSKIVDVDRAEDIQKAEAFLKNE